MAVVLQHGDTSAVTRPNIPGGPPLSEDGWRQAETLADRVADLPITHLLAAPTLACRQTLLPSAALKRRMVQPTNPLTSHDGAEQLCQQWAAPELETAALCVTPIVLAKLLTALHGRRDVDLDLPDHFSLAATTALVVTQDGHGRLLLRRLPDQPSLQQAIGPPATAGAGLEPADAALARLAGQREQLGVRLAEMRGQLVASQQAWRQLSKQLHHESQQLVVQAQVLVRRVDAATRTLGRLQPPATGGDPTGHRADDSLDKHLAEVHYRSAVLAEYVEHWLVVLDGHKTAVNIEQVAHSAIAASLLSEHAGEEEPTTVLPAASRSADAAIVVREMADQAHLRYPRQAITVQVDGELLVTAPASGIAEVLGPLLDHACSASAVGSGVPVRVQATARDLVVVVAIEVNDARTVTAHASPGAPFPVAPDWPRRGDLYLDAARRLACRHGTLRLAALAASGTSERFELRLQRAQPGRAETRS